MLPEPTLVLTLPSIHDGTTLDCRVYHPLSLTANPRAPPWLKHAAIMAHPYAPMGGSYDDPVVEAVAGQLLRNGFLVGTFNFRCGLRWNALMSRLLTRLQRSTWLSWSNIMDFKTRTR